MAGWNVIFLPTYSPYLNPIEHFWFKLKNLACKLIRDLSLNTFEAISEAYVRLYKPYGALSIVSNPELFMPPVEA